MTFTLPAAVRLAESLSSAIEEAVTRFPRKHRYAFGAELRERAWSVLSTANLAALRPERRFSHRLEGRAVRIEVFA